MSKSLKIVQLHYPIMKKLALTLIIFARRLRTYFQAHLIQVITDNSLKLVSTKPDHSGRLLK